MTHKPGQSHEVEGIGCAWALLGLNTVLIGLVAASFVQGPYSSAEQERWYRYGSVGFLLAGAIIPALVLFLARRSRRVSIAATAWMLMILPVFLWFVMMSAGGV